MAKAPRKPEGDEDDPVSVPAWMADLPPPMVDGKPNPLHYAAQLNRINLKAQANSVPGGKLLGGYDSMQRGILEAARMAGIDERTLLDQRSETEKLTDAVSKITDGHILTLSDEEISAVEDAMRRINELMVDAINHGRQLDLGESKKKWLDLMRRLRRVREMARTEDYRTAHEKNQTLDENCDEVMAMRAGHLLRMMVYVSRSDIDHQLFRFAMHHAEMALAMWLAYHNREIALDRISGGWEDGHLYDGVVMALPPGHGKTTIGEAFVLKWIVNRHHAQILIAHAQAPKAQKIKGKVATYFDPQTSNGARFLSLFPELPRLDDRDNNATYMRLKLAMPTKSPTIAAHGIKTKVSGDNADLIWFDDPCDQDIASQEEQRALVWDRINGTWMRRLRGDTAKQSRNGMRNFHFYTATFWHQDDPVYRRVEETLAALRQQKHGAVPKILVRRCGGPQDSPAFKPLWPEMYGEGYLRKTYADMRNPTLYSAQFRCRPVAEESRIIQRVRLYNPREAEHEAFMRSAVTRLSLDPAATNRQNSDSAGALLLACGTLSRTVDTPEGEVVSSEFRVRVTDAFEIKATQRELADHVVDYAKTKSVHYVHVEVRGASGQGVVDLLKSEADIDCVRHDPTNTAKKQRLRDAAPAIEDGYSQSGLRAVCEFPCAIGEDGQPLTDADGRWMIDPSMDWLVTQIYDFGYTKHDHAVDALTQVLIYLMQTGDIQIALGPVSAKAVRHDDTMANRMAVAIRELVDEGLRARHQSDNKPVELEDLAFLNAEWN